MRRSGTILATGALSAAGLALSTFACAALAQSALPQTTPEPPDGALLAPAPPPVGPASAPAEPSREAASYAPRPGPRCDDFSRGPDGSWRALGAVRFPGPRGEVRLAAGQVVAPGVYVSGLELAAILGARCP